MMDAIRVPVRKIQSLVAVILLVFSTLATSAPVVLNESQLDTVAAGYVNLHGNASAVAFGDIAITNIYVDAAQTIIQGEDGLTYTISTVTANASAIGERVETAVSAGFDTDEQIVSLDIAHVSASGTTHYIPTTLPGEISIDGNQTDNTTVQYRPQQQKPRKKNNQKKQKNRQNKNKQRNKNRNKSKNKNRNKNKNKNKNKQKQRNKNRNKRKNKSKNDDRKKLRNPVVYQNKTITLRLVTVQPTR